MENDSLHASLTQNDIHQLRSQAFHKAIPYDTELDKLVKDYPSHSFISNEAAQYTYQFLVDYLLTFSDKWFEKPRKELKILDWGCGKGHITYMLKRRGIPAVSCDILNENRDDSAFGQDTPIIRNENIHIVPLEHDYLLPFEDASFDVVLSFGVLEHVPNDAKSLQEISRILKPNGLLFCFFLPYTYSWTQKLAHMRGDFYHDRFYDKAVVTKLLGISQMHLLDFWHRALFPKNSVHYSNVYRAERFDQMLCENTFLRHLATNVEFVATKSAQ